MSVAAIMLVKDEVDIIGSVIAHLMTQVDSIYVMDNMSTDGTREILEELDVVVIEDNEVGYYQSVKTTKLAHRAEEDGHKWVVPCDADEIWIPKTGETISDFLRSQDPDVQVVRGAILNHMPTCLDDKSDPDPVSRIRWRMKSQGKLPKVAVRTYRTLTIHAGNHSADYGRLPHNHSYGLLVHHFTWRDEDQYVKKIRNGLAAYAATNLPEDFGSHWRMWEGRDEDAMREHFQTWFYSTSPEDDDLVEDPTPITYLKIDQKNKEVKKEETDE